MKKWTYITDGIHSIASFTSVKPTVSIFVEEFGDYKISIANDAITI